MHRTVCLILSMLWGVTAVFSQTFHVDDTAPTIVNRPLSAVPNAQAMVARFWVPDLDAGFVPQGLAWQAGSLILGGYTSTDVNQSRGPCQIVWINPASGAVTDRLALPAACGHAGGMAALPGQRLVVADTKWLFVITSGKVTATIRLKGKLRGSFADFDGTDLWIGLYDKNDGQLWRLPVSALQKPELEDADALETLAAPAGLQGLAFDHSGQMWAAASGSKTGEILKLDRKTGGIVARYPAPAGIEDISFDSTGRLWASSEAGSRRWSNWATFFPLVFAFDVGMLR